MDPCTSTPNLTFREALTSTWKCGNPIDKAPQTNLDSRPRSEPALELHSRAVSSEGVMSPFQRSQHRKQFRRKADNKKTGWKIIYEFANEQYNTKIQHYFLRDGSVITSLNSFVGDYWVVKCFYFQKLK